MAEIDPLNTKTPVLDMWNKYRNEVLTEMGDMSAETCKLVFFSAAMMSEAYFHYAVSTPGTETFTELMNRFHEEVAAELNRHKAENKTPSPTLAPNPKLN